MSSRQVYYGLDIVRFFAAFIVMLFHFTFRNWPISSVGRVAYSPVSYLAEAGWVGVPIFFVLSGFVIAFSSADCSAKMFVRGRILRLYPVAWICSTSSALLLLAAGQAVTIAEYSASMTLWPLGPWISGVYWTLAVEAIFYAVVAMTILLVGSKGLPALAVLLSAGTTAYLILRIIGTLTGKQELMRLVWFESPTGSLFLLSSGAYFSFGIGLWHTLIEGKSRFWLFSVGWPAILSFLCVVGGSRYQATIEGYGLIRAGVAPSLWVVAVACIAASVRYSAVIKTFVGDRGKVVRNVGLMTYPLYLLHDPIGIVILPRYISRPWSALLVAMVSSILAAFIVVKLEPAVRSMLSRTISFRKAYI